MKTKVEIIEETADFYNTTNRGMLGRYTCIYLSEITGNKCAVGRCMTDEGLKDYGNVGGDVGELNYTAKGLDSILKDEYKGHDVDFWKDLQRFHDEYNYWNETGLSEMGKIRKNSLIKKYV
jgi:hypothetical protein